ncbi:MAG: D-tyrosyl-tRNA(Tyr) deacylase [Alphaproteobacteria bacterium]|nr:D-tyrosyl-tRNA(Tyr) deacylase [Alphaproteobacteria bacterium]
MRAVVQRVSEASVTIEGEVVGRIGAGFLVLLGVGPADGAAEVDWLARKIAGLRVLEDEQGRMNRSLLDAGAGALVVSQFTLYGDCRKGRRPSFVGAAPPEHAEPLYEAFCEALAAQGVTPVERGRFGADMKVALVNDGPVTLILDSSGADVPTAS